MPFNRPIPDPAPKQKDSAPHEPKPVRGGPADSGGLATLVQAESLMQIAILLPSAAFIGWLLGAWADRAWHQSWLGIAGIVFGGISGLVYVVRLVIASGGETKSGSSGAE
jgi:ATP synthase protein I